VEAGGLVLMEKDNEILSKELGSYSIESGIELVYKAYVVNNVVYLYLTMEDEVTDEEYNKIFDEYTPQEFDGLDFEVEEVDDEYNPVWLYKMDFVSDDGQMEAILNDIIESHKREIERIKREL
jgi:uncharacterized protein YchJ